MAEYENFLRGLDHIGNGWVLVQKLLVPPRSVNQTHASAKERWETYGDRGQHRSVNEVSTAFICCPPGLLQAITTVFSAVRVSDIR